MVALNFDANTVAPATAMDPVPASWYPMVIRESTNEPTSSGTGAYLQLTMEVIEGQYKGRKAFDRLNLSNPNPLAVEIAYKALSAICHATGVIQCADSSQLHNRPMMVKLAVRPAETAQQSKDGKAHDASNEVKGYKAYEAQQQPAAFGGAPGGFTTQPAAAPAAAPAWQPPQQQPVQAAPAWQPPPAAQGQAAPLWAGAAAPAAVAPTAAPASGLVPPWVK